MVSRVVHVYSVILVGAILLGCDARSDNTPALQLRHDIPYQWSVEEMAGDASEDLLQQGKQVRVVDWQILSDPKRSITLEQAIVLIESVNNGNRMWRVASVYRHPGMKKPPEKWRLIVRVGAPLTNMRDFNHSPSEAELARFKQDSDWDMGSCSTFVLVRKKERH